MARRLFPRLTDDINKALGNITDAFQNAVQNMSDAARAAAGQVVARTDEVTLYENSTSSVSIKPQDNDIGRNVKLIDADKGDLNGVVTHNTNSIYASLRLYSGSYDYLDEGETETAEATYTIQAANGKTDTGIIRVTIVGFNDSHWGAGGHETFSEDDPVISIDLLDHFYDPEGHAMSVTVNQIRVEGPLSLDGLTTSLNGSVLTLDNPELLNPLGAYQDLDIFVDYTVTSKGYATQETARIEIEGQADLPDFHFADPAQTVEEGYNPGFTFGFTVDDDPDLENSYRFVVVGGADAALFEGYGYTNVAYGAADTITFKQAPNFETPKDVDGDNVYEIDVAVVEAGVVSDPVSVSIAVTDRPDVNSYTPSGLIFAEETGIKTYDLSGVLSNPADAEGLTFSVIGAQLSGVNPIFSVPPILNLPGMSPTLLELLGLFEFEGELEPFDIDVSVDGTSLFIDTDQFEPLSAYDLGTLLVEIEATDEFGATGTGIVMFSVIGDDNPGPPSPPGLIVDNPAVMHEENVAGVEGFGVHLMQGEAYTSPYNFALPNGGQAELAIVGGADADLFRLPAIYYGGSFVVGEIGTIVFDEAPDFENPMDTDGDNIYEVEVAAIDAFTQSDPVTLYIQVTDVIDETPAI